MSLTPARARQCSAPLDWLAYGSNPEAKVGLTQSCIFRLG